jgi:hypothetical protein
MVTVLKCDVFVPRQYTALYHRIEVQSDILVNSVVKKIHITKSFEYEILTFVVRNFQIGVINIARFAKERLLPN